MKTKFFLIAMFATLSAFRADAQASENPVGILPGTKPGVVKIVYVRQSPEAVSVKFISDEGIIRTDRIGSRRFNQGFLKKYDVSQLQGSNFWIEVSSGAFQVRYKMQADQRGRLVPTLESQTDPRVVATATH